MITHPHALILGGTLDARKLATLICSLHYNSVQITTSLAGRTSSYHDISGNLRIGGFGGVGGLISFLRSEHVSVLVDATHPFAKKISQHAKNAAVEIGIPFLTIHRPPWKIPDSLNVKRVPDMNAAAAELVRSNAKRALLTIGVQNLDAFSNLPDIWLLVRQIECRKPYFDLANSKTIIRKPPFSIEGEKKILTQYQIDTLVSKESGGHSTEAKITAAADLHIHTILIKRPEAPSGECVSTPEEALVWIQARLGLNT